MRPDASVRAGGRPRRSALGYSLIELMVTVAVIAILASIAFPTYRGFVLKSNRTDAIRALTDDAQILRRCYSQTFTFAGCAAVPPASPGFVLSPNGYYKLSSAIAAGPPQTFVLTAKYTGAQTSDQTCAEFTLDQTGTEYAQDSGGTDQTTTCWGAK